jgi:PAS domain S-box-containing protein
MRSVLWFPFFFREHGFHLLVFNQHADRDFDRDELDFVSAVGRHVSLALVKQNLREDLALSRERYRALYDYAPSMFFTIAEDRRVVSLNRFAMEHLGYSEEEVLNADVLSVFVPEDREAIKKQLENAFARPGQVFRWEARKRCKDGKVISVRESARAGRTLGDRLEAFVVCDDVTDQKRTEQAMLQTQKLETLGVLVGGISHDFNNLLGAIMGNTELALMQLPEDSPARESIELATVAASRAAELVKQLLSYSTRAPFQRKRVGVNAVVRELAELLVVTVGKKAKVELQLDASEPKVVTDPTQLRQVLMNLVHNAADAMAGREGSIVVRTSLTALGESNSSALPAGRYASIQVIDMGVGIEPALMERIFDPFFTTRAAGRGLGLSAVRSIAHRHGGRVLVESTVGKGSTFTVLLPEAAPEVPVAAPAKATEPADLPAGATVLVVDDDPSVLRVLADITRQLGLIPLTAGGAAAGRELFLSHPEIACVLLDLTMPEGGGAPLAKELHALRPSSPILLISGFAEPEVTSSLAGELSGFLHKPFTPLELKSAIAKAVRH